MKEGWKYKKLGDVIDHLRTGLNPRTHFKLNTPDSTGYYITVRELKGFTIEPDEKTYKVNSTAIIRINERSNLKIGDVLFSGTGTIGKTALVSELPDNWNIKEGVYAMTPKHSELDSKYFIYYIGSDFFLRLVNDKAAGTGVRSIPMKELVKLPISVPSLSEQKSIVDYLDSAFAKIDAMKANAEKALNEAKALFQASLKEMLEPKDGWEESTFGDVCWYKRNNGVHKGTRYIGMEHIEQGTGKLLGTISSDEVLSNTFAFNKGDVLYGRLRPYLKKVIVADFDGCCSTEIFPIQSQKIIAPFLMYWFLTDVITNKVNATCAGCRMPRGNMNDVLKFLISYPTIKEQQNIVDVLDAIKSKVDRLQENFDKISQECDALKQAILKQVFE